MPPSGRLCQGEQSSSRGRCAWRWRSASGWRTWPGPALATVVPLGVALAAIFPEGVTAGPSVFTSPDLETAALWANGHRRGVHASALRAGEHRTPPAPARRRPGSRGPGGTVQVSRSTTRLHAVLLIRAGRPAARPRGPERRSRGGAGRRGRRPSRRAPASRRTGARYQPATAMPMGPRPTAAGGQRAAAVAVDDRHRVALGVGHVEAVAGDGEAAGARPGDAAQGLDGAPAEVEADEGGSTAGGRRGRPGRRRGRRRRRRPAPRGRAGSATALSGASVSGSRPRTSQRSAGRPRAAIAPGAGGVEALDAVHPAPRRRRARRRRRAARGRRRAPPRRRRRRWPRPGRGGAPRPAPPARGPGRGAPEAQVRRGAPRAVPERQADDHLAGPAGVERRLDGAVGGVEQQQAAGPARRRPPPGPRRGRPARRAPGRRSPGAPR